MKSWDPQIAATMPFANKQLRNRKTVQHDRTRPHVPMGDQRFQQLMSELGAAFAQVDDGEGKRRQARERNYQHELWLTQRQATLVEVIATMRQHGLSVEDLV